MGRRSNLIKEELIPTIDDLAKKYHKLTNLELIIYNSCFKISDIYLSFIGGIITSIPITIFFEIISFKLAKDLKNNIMLSLTVLFFITCSILTAIFIKMVVLHSDIYQEKNKCTMKEEYINQVAKKIFDNISFLKKMLIKCMILVILCLIIVISIFILNNICI